MKIKLRNISGIEKSIQLDGFNYTVVKPGEVVEREVRSENHIPDGWEIVTKGNTAPTTGKKATGKPPVIITENHNAPIADSGVTTSEAIKGLI